MPHEKEGVMRFPAAIRGTRLVLSVTTLAIVAACGPGRGRVDVPRRNVPYPLSKSEQAGTDSVVRELWTCRGSVADPLAVGENAPRLTIDAVLYGEDVIAAEIADSCAADSLSADACVGRLREAYDEQHKPGETFRVAMQLESTFSVNSVNHRFWDIYIEDEEEIMHEPLRIAMDEPVVVRRDTLPEPGRAPVRAGLYRRDMDLYFAIRTPFGTKTISPSAPEVKLVISRNQRRLAVFVWEIESRESDGESARADSTESVGQPGI